MASQAFQHESPALELPEPKRVKHDDKENWRCMSTDGGWNAFYNQWWGEEGRKRLDDALESQSNQGRILRIEQRSVYSSLRFLGSTHGSLLLHQELLDIYKRLKNACNLDVAGVVLTGQPGVGKSTALAYILLERLADKQATFLTTCNVTTYWFDHSGVWIFVGPRQIEPNDTLTLGVLESERVWSLIDASEKEDPPPSELVSEVLFPVHAVSPKAIRYKEWRKQLGGIRWVMQPWSWSGNDLFNCLKLNRKFQQLSDADKSEKFRDAQQYCAPCPRDIIDYISYPAGFIDEIETSIKRYNVDTIEEILSGFTRLDISTLSHSSFLIRRIASREKDFDSFVLDFKSSFVQEKIMARFRLLELNEARKLFSACSVIPESSILSGWIFESLAIRYTSGPVNDSLDVFGPFKKMILSNRDSNDTYHDSTFAASGDSLIIHETEKGSLSIMRGTGTVLYKPPPAVIPSHFTDQGIFSKPRHITYYRDINDPVISVQDNSYYVPSKRNNPLFDSFFFHSQTIWFLQMTTAKRHGGASAGYDVVRKLRDMVFRKTGQPANLKYVLVVPQRHYRVAWKMPSGWDDQKVKGEVFVQYLDLEAIQRSRIES